MSRVEKYRQIRRIRRKYLLAIFLCVLLLISGVCVVDYSVNTLIDNGCGIGLLKIKKQNSQIELSVLNRRLYFNTAFLENDVSKIKNSISNFVNSKK